MGHQPLDRCPCCGYRTGCSTCPVCFWTEDGRRDTAAQAAPEGGPNGELTLGAAQLNFAVYGASHPRYRTVVRPPRPDEMP